MSDTTERRDLDRTYPTHAALPLNGLKRADVLAEVRARADAEREQWSDGFASGAVYHGDPEHIAFLNEVYALTSQLNPLHTDIWPSGIKYEREIVAMSSSSKQAAAFSKAAWAVIGHTIVPRSTPRVARAWSR